MSLLGRIARKNLAINDEKAWNPALWNLIGTKSPSGEIVNEETALTYSAVYNANTLISGTIGSLPLHLYKTDGRIKKFAEEESLYSILHDWPNPFMTALTFRETLASHVLLWGNGFGEIVRNVMGEVVELWPIPPNRVKSMTMYENDLWYEIVIEGSESKWLPRKQILHVPGLGFDGFLGQSVIRYANKSIGLGMAMETFGSNYFGQGTHPGVIVSHPSKLSEVAHSNLKKSLTESYSGLGQSHRLMLLQEGLKMEKVGIPPDESQFLECVTPGTLITMASGDRKLAKELKISDRVIGWEDGPIISEISAVGAVKVKNLIRIKTARGRELIASEDHPCLTIRKLRTPGGRIYKRNPEEWVALKDLTVGNYVRIALEIPVEISPDLEKAMTFDEAYFLGAMVGNGYIRKGACTFSSGDEKVVSKMREIVESFGGELKRNLNKRNKYDHDLITNGRGCEGSIIRNLLNESGMVGKHAATKTVPKSVICGGRDAWRGFLSGYFDTDGTIRKVDDKQTPAMSWSSVSLPLLQESQHLLTMLGIQSAIYFMEESGDKVIMGATCKALALWGLFIMGVSELKKASKEFNIVHTNKAERLSGCRDVSDSRYRMENFIYDRVISIEEMGLGETIGLEVKGCHTHITSGIVTHNSRQFQIPEVARWFNLPPHKLKDLTKSSFNNIESEQINFVTDSILPWLIRFEQNYNMQLVGREKRRKGKLYFKHVVEGLLRANSKDRAEFYKALIGTTMMTPNEGREKEDMNPMKDPMADELYIMANMIPLSKLEEYLKKAKENTTSGNQKELVPDDAQPSNVLKIGAR
jgi:phage portal protein BeeE